MRKLPILLMYFSLQNPNTTFAMIDSHDDCMDSGLTDKENKCVPSYVDDRLRLLYITESVPLLRQFLSLTSPLTQSALFRKNKISRKKKFSKEIIPNWVRKKMALNPSIQDGMSAKKGAKYFISSLLFERATLAAKVYFSLLFRSNNPAENREHCRSFINLSLASLYRELWGPNFRVADILPPIVLTRKKATHKKSHL